MPDSAMLCVPDWALVVTTMVVERAALTAGLKVTLIVQLFSDATAAVHVLVWVKSPGSAPVNAMLLTESDVRPMFVNVIDLAALAVAVFTVPKARLVPLYKAIGSMTVAVNMTVCGLPAALVLYPELQSAD